MINLVSIARRRSSLIWVIAVLSAATGAKAQEQPREIRELAWHIATAIPGHMDSPLLRPGLMVASVDTAYLFDYGDGALKAFDLETGALLWRFGRHGGGPGEFNNPTDLRMADDGTLWLLDPANLRISFVAPSGESLGSVRVQERLFRLGPITDGRALAIRSEPSEGLVVVLDTAGGRVSEIRSPEWTSDVPSMAAGVWVADDPKDGNVAVVFPYSGRALYGSAQAGRLREVEVIQTQPEPEHLIYSPREGMIVRRLPPSARMLALSIALIDSEIWILVNGGGEQGNRIVDRYDERTGEYLGSWLLPIPLKQITGAGRRMVGLQTDMFPTVLIFERP